MRAYMNSTQRLIDHFLGIGIRLGFGLQVAAVLIYMGINRREDVAPARNGFKAFSTAPLIDLSF